MTLKRAGGDGIDISVWTFPEVSTEEPELFLSISTTSGAFSPCSFKSMNDADTLNSPCDDRR